ncbi:heat-inducible transcription repressor HrcA [Granulicella pectinivorans]|uniref:Heat-inducible transcription repressor HrcA n=1 Tax=Granulicella pectinivorans TaxID=474950 RepID=A0A1I6M709_9BACT|nr:heat-inducible transcriptional repressor HrcA [Granulicella pectinivorans]SFS11467.1 heat-inducible transcription repressor HrcA [Granulicella pectinivorans]
MSDERVTARQRAILMTILERYIATGEPVSSGTIAASLGTTNLSSATVRNEMADLADAGLLEQPHTSAGRIPTARAFRMYVEQLRVNDGGGLVGLSAVSRSQIDRKFAGVNGTSEVLERTSHVLATLSSGVGLAVTAAAGLVDTLEHIHFSRLAPARVLAVVVTQSGQVRDRVLALEKDLSTLALETASRFLNESFRGWSMEAVRSELTRLVEGERMEYQRMLEARALWAKAVPEGSAGVQQTVYVEGVANLIGGQDGARLRDLLSALEAKQRLVELLNAYIDARQESVRVVFDLEEQAPEMAGLVLIAAPARMQGETRGTVGVIGPKRMQYEQTMSAVMYMARVFDRMLETPGGTG